MARREITGSAPAEAEPPLRQRERRPRGPPTLAFRVQEFCDQHRISKAHYYNLKRQGLGPRETELLGVVIITSEDATAWRARLSAISARKSA